MSENKKIKRGRAIDCNIRQELAEVADAVTERKGHTPVSKQKKQR